MNECSYYSERFYRSKSWHIEISPSLVLREKLVVARQYQHARFADLYHVAADVRRHYGPCCHATAAGKNIVHRNTRLSVRTISGVPELSLGLKCE